MEEVNTCDVDLEEGELSDSSEDVYTPLQRPVKLVPRVSPNTVIGTKDVTEASSPLTTCHQMQSALEDDESQSDLSDSSSGESSDSCFKKMKKEEKHLQEQKKRKNRFKRTVMVRVQPTDSSTDKRTRFKKYNIWTAALQEDTLTETMRECDASLRGCNDRNVENYDFSLRYHLKNGNTLKRRLSTSTEEISDGELHSLAKRGRQFTEVSNEHISHKRSVKSRLGHRRGRRGSSPASGGDSFEPRNILNLDPVEGREKSEIALEIANKLYEEKSNLLTRIVETLGVELSVEIYKETQRIEANGGLLINNGCRRRTPGGVYLYLLKNHEKVSAEDQKLIFMEDQQDKSATKWRKVLKSIARDRKVEELKKRLNEKEKGLSTLMTRKEHFLLGSDLSLENQSASLSNPPPSPVFGQDPNFEYKTQTMNDVTTEVSGKDVTLTSPNCPPANSNIVSYDDDFLDINCGVMDFA